MYAIKAPLRNAMLARGERLAEFLNYEESDAAEGVLEQLVTMQQLLERIVDKGQHIRGGVVDSVAADRDTGLWCYWASDKKVAALLPTVNGKLVKYGWEVLWMVKLTRRGPASVPLWLKNPSRPTSGHPFGYMLRDCLEDRSLAHVRRCPVCRQWFMAGRADQQNCSKRCRSQCGVRSTPKRWREYQRYYRKTKTLRTQIEQLQTQLLVSKRPGIRLELARLTAEYKSRLQRHNKGEHHAKN